MDYYFTVLSTLILFTAFLLIANKRPDSYIKTFRAQSLLLALTTAIMGTHNLFAEGHYDVMVVCLLIIILKVIYIPNLLQKTQANVAYVVEKDFFSSIPLLVILCCGIVAFTYFTLISMEGMDAGPVNIQLVNSVSVILIGLLFMISRKRAIGQIIGLLVIENGLYITGIFATHGLPFIVDLGIFIDLITAVIVLAMMVFKLNDEFSSIDTNKLKKLRG
ncbi:MAG: hydrogenase [Bacillota bacterium]|nr:hydrogenase [Bacillota bacterium]